MTSLALRPILTALLALLSLGALGGCVSDTGEEDEEVESSTDALLSAVDRKTCNPRSVTDREARRGFDPNAPLLVFYGAYHGVGDSKDNLRLLPASSDPTRREYVTAADANNVCGTTSDPRTAPAPEYNEWRARGGRVARKMAITELENALDRAPSPGEGRPSFAATKLRAILGAGYFYIAVDELRTAKYAKLPDGPDKDTAPDSRIVGPNTEWQNAGIHAKRFGALLGELAGMGLDRRIVFYANGYHMSDDGLPASSGRRLRHFSKVLGDCAEHCRALALEIYLSARNVARGESSPAEAARDEQPGDCYQRGLSCIPRLAEQFIAAGGAKLASRLVTVIGTSDLYTSADAAQRCRRDSSSDAITRQYATIHAHAVTAKQPGIGFYSLTRAERDPAVQADCLARRNRFGWARAK